MWSRTNIAALRRARFRMLDAALPLHHGPTRIVVLRHLAEYLPEIDLPIAERAEATRPVDPVLIAAINARAPTRPELRILHVKCANALVIEIEKSQIIQLLQNHVAGIVKNVGARMISDSGEKALEGRAVVQVFAGMQLEAYIHARFVEGIQDRQPAPPQFLERFVDQPRRPLRPGIEKRPRQRAGECRMRRQAQITAGACAPTATAASPTRLSPWHRPQGQPAQIHQAAY